MASSLIAYQHFASDLMISRKTLQDDGVIFTQQQLWHVNGGGDSVSGYFESSHNQARPFKPSYLRVCVC